MMRAYAAIVSLWLCASCAYLAPPEYSRLVVRESHRPTDWQYEIVRVHREEAELRTFEAWIRTAAPEDFAASALALLLTGWNAALPGSIYGNTPGADTYVSWHVDPGITASHFLLQRLQARRGIEYLLKPPYAAELTSTGGMLPVREQVRFIRADLHIHSAFSHDSATPIRDILRVAHDRGLDVISITDHDILSYDRVLAVQRDMEAHGELRRPLVVIPGVEISSADGHIMAYFVRQSIPPGMDARATINAIHRQGGIAVLAHPNRPEAGVDGGMGRNLPFDGVEAINGAQLFPLAWRADLDEANDYSPNKYGASDAHFAQWLGAAYTVMAVTELTENGVRDAMQAGLVKAEIGNRALSGFAIAMEAPVLKQALQAANWPRRTWQRSRSQLAEWLHVDDVYLKTSWRDIWLDAYRINRLLSIEERRANPRESIQVPPLPIEYGIRFRGAKLFVSTPLSSFSGNPSLVFPTLIDEKIIHERDVVVFDFPRKDIFFIWPYEIFAGIAWEWIF